MKALILKNAQSYLGVITGSQRHHAIIDAYNAKSPKPMGYTVRYTDDWCDVFVTHIADISGASGLIGRECGVERHIQGFKQRSIWLGKQRPLPGDVITFDWDAGGFADHIGFVEKVVGDTVITIEGNSKRMVRRNQYHWKAPFIRGIARPHYPYSQLKPIPLIVQEVLDRKWGNGNERIQRLTQAGYHAPTIQRAVNAYLKTKANQPRLAKEILAGKWGNGTERQHRLEQAGYDYLTAQQEVNRLVG